MPNSDMLHLTDTHTHLYLEEFNNDRDQLIHQAREKGVSRFFLPNIDSTSLPSLYELCDTFPDWTFPMIGLHPCSVNLNFKNELDIIHDESVKRKFYAVGEIGLDFYWDQSFIRQQEEAFISQLRLADQLHLPVVIHSRNSTDRIIELLKEHHSLNPKGIFHCFSGSESQAREIIELGMYLGIGGVLTFKNSGLDKVIAGVPADRIVLETDAPYLAPAPYRGKRNLPAYLLLVAEKLAAIKGITIEEVAEITTSNADTIFGLSS